MTQAPPPRGQPPEDRPQRPAPRWDRLRRRRSTAQSPESSQRQRLGRAKLPTRALTALIAVALMVTVAAFAQAAHGQPPNRGASRPTTTTTITPRSATGVPASGDISRSITVVGIGDSVTSGYNCSCEAFVGLYATQLAAQDDVATSSVNLGVPGWTSSQLLAAMTKPGAFRNQVAKACLLYTSPSPRDRQKSRMPSSA